jgi:hypothetical protein
MHRLTRRAMYATMGIGLGITATLTLGTAPGAAQSDIEAQTTRFLINWMDFHVPTPLGAGDSVTATGQLFDDEGQKVGESHLSCGVTDVDSDGWLGACHFGHELADGDLYLTSHLKYDQASDGFLEADAAVTGATGSYNAAKWKDSEARHWKCTDPTDANCDDDSYYIEHTWSDPNA